MKTVFGDFCFLVDIFVVVILHFIIISPKTNDHQARGQRGGGLMDKSPSKWKNFFNLLGFLRKTLKIPSKIFPYNKF